MPSSKVTEKCKKCVPAKCCSYISLEIDDPEDREDYEYMLWYLAHKDVSIYIEEGDWHVNFDARCKMLGDNNLCQIYDIRPDICREYDTDECPEIESFKYDFEYEFRSYEQLLDYLCDVEKFDWAIEKRESFRKMNITEYRPENTKSHGCENRDSI